MKSLAATICRTGLAATLLLTPDMAFASGCIVNGLSFAGALLVLPIACIGLVATVVDGGWERKIWTCVLMSLLAIAQYGIVDAIIRSFFRACEFWPSLVALIAAVLLTLLLLMVLNKPSPVDSSRNPDDS